MRLKRANIVPLKLEPMGRKMELSKPIARKAAILMKSTLLLGILATVSVTSAYEASAADGCRSGLVRYHGQCMTYRQRAAHKRIASKADTPAPAPAKTCPFTVPITGQVINLPC